MMRKIFKRYLSIVSLVGLIILLSPVNAFANDIGGGIINGIIHDGLFEDCHTRYSSANATGKSIDIDGTTIKLPVDWNYAHSQQSDFKGNNWEGDDSARGIGIFNCTEEGDKSVEYENAYAINMRFEYQSYGYTENGWPTHAKYKGTSESGIEVGGTSASCLSGGNTGSIIDLKVNKKEAEVTKKAKIIVYNPETSKACVCAPGFNAIGGDNHDCNWGGAPLALFGGITKKVAETIGAEQNKSVLEMVFADVDAELGPCDYNGETATSTISGGSLCVDTSSADTSSIASLAVSAAYDPNAPTFAGHKMIMYKAGSTSTADLPTTEIATKIRKIATGGEDRSADCGHFVSSVLACTVDRYCCLAGTSNQLAYYRSHSDKYQEIDTCSVSDAKNILQPGDILVNDGHTMLYVGNDAITAQFDYLKGNKDYVFVGASWDQYGPQIETWQHYGNNKAYTIFRFIGTPDPNPDAVSLK